MTNYFTQGQCRRLAQKMVWSLSDSEAETMKRRIAAKYRAGVRQRRVLVVTGIALFLGVLIWPLLSYLNDGDALSPGEVARNVAQVTGKSPPANRGILQRGSDGTGQKHARESDRAPRATPLTPGTRFAVEEESAVSTYRITRGSVRFETGPEVTRQLVVRVGELTIVDIGTVFTVETVSYDQVRVAVSEGRVKVTWPTGHAELKEGTDGTFPSTSRGTPGGGAATGETNRSNAVGRGEGKGMPQSTDWRVAARNGQNLLALQLIEAEPARVRNKVADLLLAADVMRLTDNPRRSLPYLRRVVRQFPDDDRQPVAAFTLGKVLLNEIGNPRAAAQMFAIAAKKRNPLAEEAMAREAEAWYRAGDLLKSTETARRYLEKYPGGARAESVRAFQNDIP